MTAPSPELSEFSTFSATNSCRGPLKRFTPSGPFI